MKDSPGLSRRKVFGAAAALPTAGALLADTTRAHATAAPALRVAATVLRTSPSQQSESGLRVGLRVSILGSASTGDTRVMVIDPVDFDASPGQLRRQLAAGVQQQVQQRLAMAGTDVETDRIAVQVFGGPL